MTAQRGPVVGLALGSGSSRGWAHIGVIRALEQAGISPNIVCGTSIGALVGAAYAAGELDRLESWARSLRKRDVIGLTDLTLSAGGMLKGDRLMELLGRNWPDRPIEELGIPFAAVATSLRTGDEVWLRRGSTLQAVRSSIALPGIFTPVRWEGLLLVDGGLVNPVPVSVARAMGADIVIAVDLGSDKLSHRFPTDAKPEPPAGNARNRMRELKANIAALTLVKTPDEPAMPSTLDVLSASADIVAVSIARSRMASEPPEVVVTPRLAHLRLLDFHLAEEAIEEGHDAVHRVADSLAGLDAGAGGSGR